MARKGNPISVRLDLNRSSDPSRFSEGRALRQFTLSTGKSAGRNSSGRITVFHRGGGSKRLQRRIDLKRSTSSMGIVERIDIMTRIYIFFFFMIVKPPGF